MEPSLELAPFAVAMLAGGKGSRLGGLDKSKLVIDDDEIGAHTVVVALLAGAAEVLAIGGNPEILSDQGWRCVADRWPGEGPLGGIVTALESASTDLVVVVGCDQPDLTPEGLLGLVEALSENPSLDAVLTEVDGFVLATHSVWRRRARTPLMAAFESGDRSVKRALSSLRTESLPPLDAEALRDIDTPSDLERRTQR